MELVVVDIETHLGVHYTFPDMDSDVFGKVLKQEDSWRRLGNLVLYNASEACMIVPTRIIKTIRVNGEIKWTASTVSTASP